MRHFIMIAVGGLLAATAWANPGYLPVVGPSPLRFATPVPPEDRMVLPPLAMDDAKPADTNGADVATIFGPMLPATNRPPATATNVVAVTKNVPTPPAPASTNAVAPVAEVPDDRPMVPPIGSDSAVLSPQMLLPYFRLRSGTTNREVNVVVPQSFTPPPAPAQRSSTATFNVP